MTRGKVAVRRERRSIVKRRHQADELRRTAVAREKEGDPLLAKQAVRHLVQLNKEMTARSIAVGNMEYALEQVQMKDNYDEFVRGMRVVADIEELVARSVDPEETRERLADLAQRNQELIEPWTEGMGVEAAHVAEQPLTSDEQEAYDQVVADAAGAIVAGGREMDGDMARIDADLEQKMDLALGKE